MEPFTTLTAVAIPIDQPNLDTDQIIPARFLGSPRPTQKPALFHDLRYDPVGKPRPDFVMNQPGFAGAGIVVAERNFACGSSRENGGHGHGRQRLARLHCAELRRHLLQ